MSNPLNGLLAACLAAALFAAAPVAALGDAPATPQQVFDRVEAGHLKVTDALDALEDLDHDPGDPMALAVRGTLMTMRAAEEWLPYNKLRSVNAGLELLDQATAGIEPSHDDFLRVYTFAAVANAAVPAFLDRADFARRYFDAVRGHPQFGAMEPQAQARILAWLARLEGPETGAGGALLAQARALDAAVADAVLTRE